MPVLRAVLWILAFISLVLSWTGVEAQVATPISPIVIFPGSISISDTQCNESTELTPAISIDETHTEGAATFEISQPDEAGNYAIVGRVLDPAAFVWGEVDSDLWSHQSDGSILHFGVVDSQPCEPQLNTVTPEVEDEVSTPEAVSQTALMVPLASTCPAAATGTELSAANVITSTRAIIIRDGVESDISDDGEINLDHPWEQFRIEYTYSAGNPSAGDYFTVPLPEHLSTFDVMTRTLTDPDGIPMACMTVQGGEIEIVFLDYVDTHENISGRFWAQYNVDLQQTEENETIVTTLFGSATVTINVEGTGPVGPADYFGKDGWFYDNSQGANNPTAALVWRLTLPQQSSSNVNIVIADSVTGSNWVANCDHNPYPSARPDRALAPGELEFTWTCDPVTGWKITITRVPTDVSLEFYLRGDITNPQGPFKNLAEYRTEDNVVIVRETEVRYANAGGDGDGDNPSPTPVTPEPSPSVTPETPEPTPSETPETPEPTPSETPVAGTPEQHPTETPKTPDTKPTAPAAPVSKLPSTGSGANAPMFAAGWILMAVLAIAGGITGWMRRRYR